jgi:predicted nucleic acid-binding protein
MIVVDTNIIGYLFITGEFSDEAEKVLIKDPHWSVPLLWRSELRSVLTLYMQKNILSLEETKEIMESATQLMENNEYDVASDQVLELVVSSALSAYDCEYIALARDLGVKLVTTDKAILKSFPEFSITPKGFVNRQHL